MSLSLFATVFGVIFVAELPDKTALATLVLATRHKALPVFLGAALALTVQSVVAVLGGSLLAKLPAAYVHIGSGVLFLVCAVLMWIRKPDDEEAKHAQETTGFWRALWAVFAVVFVAEWGDLTQIGTAAFEARYHAWLTVMLGPLRRSGVSLRSRCSSATRQASCSIPGSRRGWPRCCLQASASC